MEISKKGNTVFDHGKKLIEVYALASAPKTKGLALYDANFLNDRPINPKTGKPIKRFIWLILDEFQMAEGLENNLPLRVQRRHFGKCTPKLFVEINNS